MFDKEGNFLYIAPEEMKYLVLLAKRCRWAKQHLRTIKELPLSNPTDISFARGKENEAWNALQTAKTMATVKPVPREHTVVVVDYRGRKHLGCRKIVYVCPTVP